MLLFNLFTFLNNLNLYCYVDVFINMINVFDKKVIAETFSNIMSQLIE